MKGIALGLCQWKDSLLWYQGKIWIPKDEGIQTTLIAKHHEPPQAEHGGTAKTTEIISRRYYWPKIREDIKRFIKNCETHQQNVFAGPEVTWLPLVPLNPLVHHLAPRSRRFTRTLGLQPWSTLLSSQRYLVHTSLVPANPGPPFPCPGYLISLLCLFYPILHLPHIPLLLPDLSLPQP